MSAQHTPAGITGGGAAHREGARVLHVPGGGFAGSPPLAYPGPFGAPDHVGPPSLTGLPSTLPAWTPGRWTRPWRACARRTASTGWASTWFEARSWSWGPSGGRTRSGTSGSPWEKVSAGPWPPPG